MDYIVIDLEWNNAGFRNKVSQKDYLRMPFEIIEIGAVKLDGNLVEKDRFFAKVKPQLYPKISRHVSMVTKLGQNSLSEGRAFTDVMAEFEEFISPGPAVFCSWSISDPEVLLSNLRYYELVRTLPFLSLDVQHLYSLLMEDGQKSMQRALDFALASLDLPATLPFHTALSDAVYAADIFRVLMQRRGITGEREIEEFLRPHFYRAVTPHRTKFKIDHCRNRREVLRKLEQLEFECPTCLQRLTLGHKGWKKATDGTHFHAEYICSRHGALPASLRLDSKTDGYFSGKGFIRFVK